ncbi:MAG: RnfABCDGE type electron transport complex subunit D [Treponema sp.]|jgi:electron transport complex protein RnfD|nr:RnfABCDGE type electron transport complex subunit D [Treponema sp.]
MLEMEQPQVNLAQSTTLRMWMIFGCALGAVIYSAAGDGFASLGIAVAALGMALFAEALALHFGRLWKNSMARAQGGWVPGESADDRAAVGNPADGRIADGSAAASAMIFVLLLPNSINPLYVILGVCFAVLLVKFSFGGLGANWVNPALGAWLFLCLSWPGLFNQARDFHSGGGSGVDAAVRGFFNKTVLAFTGAELPSGYVDLFLGLKGEGIIADRGLPLLILGTILLSAVQVSRVWIPAVYLGLYAVLVRAFGALPGGGGIGEGDVLYCLFSGGTLAAAFFLVSDPVTGAKTFPGMLAATILAAVLAFLFRYPGSNHGGAFPAAILVNAIVPLIRRLESRRSGRQIMGPGRSR